MEEDSVGGALETIALSVQSRDWPKVKGTASGCRPIYARNKGGGNGKLKSIRIWVHP